MSSQDTTGSPTPLQSNPRFQAFKGWLRDSCAVAEGVSMPSCVALGSLRAYCKEWGFPRVSEKRMLEWLDQVVEGVNVLPLTSRDARYINNLALKE